jgi:hypothetical protein
MTLSGQKDVNFGDRQKAAATAKAALLEKFRAQPKPDDPAVLERQAAQLKVEAAREARAAERKIAQKAEADRKAAEAAAKLAEQEALAAAEAARVAAEAEAAIALKAQQKAARDARYAARKRR